MSNDEIERLRVIISKTDVDNLNALKSSVLSADYSEREKDLIIEEIEIKQYRTKEIGSSMIMDAELREGEV